MLRAPTSRAAALPTAWVPPLTSPPSALVPVAQGGKKQMPQQPALRARGRRAQRLIPPGAGSLALGGRAKLPAGVPLQHTAQRKNLGRRLFSFFSTRR